MTQKHIAHLVTILRRALVAGDTEKMLLALDTLAADADNVTELASAVGVGRTHLYRMFKPGGNPSFLAVVRMLNVLGVKLVPAFKAN